MADQPYTPTETEIPEWMAVAVHELQDEVAGWLDRHPLIRHASAIDKRNIAYIAGWAVGEIGPASSALIAAARARGE